MVSILKKWLPFGLVSLIFLPAVYADLIPPILKNALEALLTDVPQIWERKAIIGILFFIVYLFAVSFFIKDTDQKRGGIRVTLAITLAVITAIGIPNQFLLIIFGDGASGGIWGGVAGLIVVLAPVVGLTFLATKLPKEGPGSLSTLLVIIMIIVMISVVQSFDAVDKFTNHGWGGKNNDNFKISDGLALVQLGLIIWAVVQARRVFVGMGNDRPLSSSALASSGRYGFPTKEREGRISRAKNFIRNLGRGRKKKRAETLEEEEARDERAEEDVEAEASGAADAGAAIADTAKREEEAARLREDIEREVIAAADALRAAAMARDEGKRREVLRSSLERIREDVGKLVENEKTDEKFKKEGLKKLEESLAVMREAEAGCTFSISAANASARKLRRLTSKEFQGLDDFLKTKQKKINSFIKQQKSYEKKARASNIPAESQGFKQTAGSIGRQAERLQQELVIQQKKVEQLKQFKQMLETNQDAIGQVFQKTITPEINDIKKVFSDLKRIRKSGLSNLEKTFTKEYADMVSAFEKNTVAEKLNDPANPPETVIPEETAELGGVFAGMISIMATSKEFFEKTGLPLLDDAIAVVDKSKQVEIALGYLDKAILNLTNAFDQFDRACLDFQDDPKKRLELEEVKKLEDAEVMEENAKVAKEAEVVSEFDKIRAMLVQDVQVVNDHIRFIEQEMSNLNFTQQTVLSSLEDLQKMMAAGQEKKEVESEKKIEDAEKAASAAAKAASAAGGLAPPGA